MTESERRQCVAKSKRTDERCRVAPMLGAERCYHHLGTSPAAQRAKYQLEQQARRLSGLSQSEPIQVDQVVAEHLALAGEARHWKDILRGMVEQLTSVGYEASAGEQTKAAVRLYGEAMDRLDRMLTNINKLGLEARQTRLREAQTAMLGALLQQVMGRLELTDRQRELVAVVVPAEIRRLAAVPAIEGRP